MKNQNVFLHEISTVVPEYSYTQEFALDFQIPLICDTDKKKVFLKKVYERTQIKKRHSVIDDYGKHFNDYKFYRKIPN